MNSFNYFMVNFVDSFCGLTGGTCQVHKFNRYLQRLEEQSPEAIEWINRHCPLPDQWAMAHDGGHRFGHSNTNIAECVNSVLKDARRLPVTALVQHTFYNMVRYFDNRKRFYTSQMASGKVLTPYCMQLIERHLARANSHRVVAFDRHTGVCEVITGYNRERRKGGNKQVVRLNQRSCTCGKFQQLKIPCSHAIACCMEVGVDYMMFVDDVYSLARTIQCYATNFHPLGNEAYWPAIDDDDGRKVIPDEDTRRHRGHPAGRRKNEMDTGPSSQKKNQTCSRCGSVGHNRRKCKASGMC